MRDIIARLKDISQNDDHSRGCQGRQYECTCGYDTRTHATADEAVTEIERLRTELQEARDNAANERVTYAEDGTLDEIYAAGGAHLERLSERGWFLNLYRKDGSSVAIWFKSGNLHKAEIEERPAPAKGESET